MIVPYRQFSFSHLVIFHAINRDANTRQVQAFTRPQTDLPLFNRVRIFLDPYVWKRTLADHLQQFCAQASVAERQLCSRLNGGSRDVSHA